ncbi:MAG: PAS domain S-box protein [Pseudomonadota bacterium]|nr:PAS domain S-box protein [Pseudomonadota bacterium]
MESPTSNDKFPFRLFFLLFTSIALLILAGAWYVGNERISSELDITRSSEIGTVVMGVRRLDDELHAPFRQLHALVNEKAIRQAIDAYDKNAAGGMEAAFTTLVDFNEVVDKVRWIDQSGMERVRINNVAGRPEIVPAAQLQNQSDSYYFANAMRLKPGQVFISSLDLNVEHGKVEVPHKPVLRLATPVQDSKGQTRGILIIDVAAKYFLDSFTDSLVGARDHAMLLNSGGYWLVSPDSEDTFGFMFQRQKTLGSVYPEAWRAITSIPSGQVENASGLWTWSTVYPLKVSDSRTIADIPNWLVVSHLPASQLALIRQGAWTTIGVNTLILLVLFGVLSAWLARALTGRARAQAEAETAKRLAEVHHRFRLVVEANATGLLVADSGGIIVLANPALARMFGYAKEELIGQPMEILLPESEQQKHAGLRANYLRAPLPRPMGAGRDLHGRRKDGSILPVEISLSSFTENGRQFVDAVVVDISERKRIEQLHRHTETRLQLLLQTNPNGVVVVDDQGRIQMTNPALDRLFGYAPEELLDQAVEILVPEASRGQHSRLREQYLQAPSIRPMGAGLDLHGRRKDRSTFPIEVSLASFEEEGRVFVQATIVDISARAIA